MVDPCSYFLRAGLLVLRHQMERGFATRMLQLGLVLVSTGEQNARGPIGFAPPNGTRVCNPHLQHGLVLVSTGEQNARGPFGLAAATGACACGSRRAIRSRSIWLACSNDAHLPARAPACGGRRGWGHQWVRLWRGRLPALAAALPCVACR
jgi:hypothetical protein